MATADQSLKQALTGHPLFQFAIVKFRLGDQRVVRPNPHLDYRAAKCFSSPLEVFLPRVIAYYPGLRFAG
jgi:hypothetical protein